MFPDDWRHADCGESKAYICELTNATCPTGFTPVTNSNKCISVNFQTSVTYDGARSACSAQTGGTGSRLATVSDIDTYNAIKSTMESEFW